MIAATGFKQGSTDERRTLSIAGCGHEVRGPRLQETRVSYTLTGRIQSRVVPTPAALSTARCGNSI